MQEDKKISELNEAAPLTGVEIIAVVQNGETVRTTISDVLSAPGLGTTYIYGNESTNGSVRLHYNTGTGKLEIQKRILGVWENGEVVAWEA